MKKLILILFVLTCSIEIFQFRVKALAPSPWETSYGCTGDNYLLSDAGRYIPVRFTNQFLEDADHKKLCVIAGSMGGIVEDMPMNLSICPGGYTIPVDPEKPSEFKIKNWSDAFGIGYGCCPSGYPYLYEGKYCANVRDLANPSTLNCVTDASKGLACLNECSKQSTLKCAGASGDEGTALNFFAVNSPKRTNSNSAPYLVEAEEQISCNYPNCIISGANMFNETKTGPYLESEVLSLLLVCSVDQAVFTDQTCVKGTWYPTSVLNDWEGRLGEFLACNEFYNPEEKASCMSCYKDCPTENTCSYSSLGCIQTTQDGIIIRVFQIGLGVVGALAIARFIQAALLRQTADPSKIQESYDIITSIIIGIVVLLGSTVILRFIGVDILQMMPF